MALAPNTRMGAYEILELLGVGGMGEVYRAHDARLGRDVAIKILPAAVAADPDRLGRFEQEARATAALNHPNILVVYDVGTVEAVTYVVSELLDGETLRDALGDGALPPRMAIDYAIQIAHGLAAAHEKAIVHRDLKPENIFITRDGRVKILDFGLAKLAESGGPIPGTVLAEDVRLPGFTATGAAVSVARDSYTLAYLTGRSEAQLTWVDRTGMEVGRLGAPADGGTMALSRDGSRVAFGWAGASGTNRAIWISDLNRNVSSRLTSNQDLQSDPAWSPNDDHIAFTITNAEGTIAYTMPSAGGVMTEIRRSKTAASGIDDWSPDGRYLLYHESSQMLALELSGRRESILVAETNGGRSPDEGNFSPDGRAVSYNSPETGRDEVYVKTFPPTGQTWQLSNAGGVQPRWRRDGRELYYLAPDGTMMLVEITSPPPNLKASAPRPLFKTNINPLPITENYAVNADGSRFLIMDPIVDLRRQPRRIIVDWPALADQR